MSNFIIGSKSTRMGTYDMIQTGSVINNEKISNYKIQSAIS